MDLLHNENPEYLYKYLPYNQYSLQLLINNELWLGSPDMLNDPFEGEFIIKNYKELQNADFIKILLNLSKSGFYDDIFYSINCEKLLQDETEFLNRLYYFLSLYIKKHFGTTSFSMNCNSISMWSHYGNSHKGFIAIFSREKLEQACFEDSAKLIDVSYEGFPTIELLFEENKIDIKDTRFLLTGKLSEWASEQEVRIIKKHNFETFIPRLLKFSPSSFLGIVLGSRMSFEDARTIRHIISLNKGLNIDFYSAAKNEKRDQLVFNKIEDLRKVRI
jgi:hypothetical protein